MNKISNHNDFNKYINDITDSIKNIQPETKAYLNSLFVKYINAEEDLSKKILIIEFNSAKENYSFTRFQNIGDWILFGLSVFPKNFKLPQNYYISIGQVSYYKCHKILNNNWPLFEELSNSFNYVVSSVRNTYTDIFPN